ncbi:MAG: protoheme IX farnesyltransferase [Alphaproteobacteria bacterium]|nr:protoheme IX farnesyltransferase [Alphaproteobacteria bacterium]
MGTETALNSHSNIATLKDVFSLLKPRVMSLVLFTGFVGFWIAPAASQMHPLLALVALLALVLGAGASGAFNMWYERHLDAVMHRTRTRVLPTGKIMADDALAFSILSGALAIGFIGLAANWAAAFWLAFAMFFYAVIYTIILKPRTEQNIVIGGAAGAFPPVVGWAIAMGDVAHPLPWILFAIIFFWTPPHFWALALNSNEDYKRANIPMMPLVKGATHTKWQMFFYTLVLLPLCLSPYFMGYTGLIYASAAAVLNVIFIITAWRVLKSDAAKDARLMFGYSVFYLFALFLAFMFDTGL